MASFPTTVKTFSTLVDLVDSVLASHPNQRGDEITALETYLRGDTNTTVTTANVTAAENKVYNLTIAGLTANRNFVVPVASAAGMTLTVNILDGDDTYSIIIIGDTTVTINGGSAATEWDRLQTKGHSVTLRSTSTTNWIVIADTSNMGGVGDGWTAGTGTWTYASADSPTFTLTVNSDVTSVIGVGYRIKLTQTTAKYFIVTAISYSAPNTTITIYGGTDYTLANAAITLPYYSPMKCPIGFPIDPAKWTVTVTDSQDKQKTTPTINTWYGGANAWSSGSNVTIVLPIGAWKTSYSLYQYVLDTSATIATMEVTLSTSNSSESDSTMTCSIGGNGASGTITVRQTSYASKHITVASKTTYYLLARSESSNMDEINIPGSSVRSILIEAVCAYL